MPDVSAWAAANSLPYLEPIDVRIGSPKTLQINADHAISGIIPAMRSFPASVLPPISQIISEPAGTKAVFLRRGILGVDSERPADKNPARIK